MKRLMSFKSLNEAIHNESLVIHEIKRMFSEISKINPLKKDNLSFDNNIEKDKRGKDTKEFHFILQRIDPKFQSKIEKIMKKYQSVVFPKIDIIMKYKEHRHADMKLKDGDDPLDFTVLDTYTLSYTVYLKNIYIQRVKPSRFVYHCSDKKNRNSIKKNGLIPKSDKESKIWQYQSDVIYPAAVFATNNTLWDATNDVWVIDTKGLPNKWWYDLYFRKESNDGKILTFEPIPPSHLELIDKQKEDVWDRISMNKSMPY